MVEKNKCNILFFRLSFGLRVPFFSFRSNVLNSEWQSFTALFFCLFAISHDLQKRVVDKEQEKQKILEDTKELTEKNSKISQEMEKMNQELKNVEK